MRHRIDHAKLGKPTDQRMSLLRNQVAQLILSGEIRTTQTRAKEVQRLAEKLITTAKRNTVHSRRLVERHIQRPPLDPKKARSKKWRSREHPERRVLEKLFDEIAPRYADRDGGYTRIVKVPPRRGDAAPMAVLMLV